MIYTFTSTIPHLTLDFMRFDRCVWHTSDPELAQKAREHPLLGKEFFDTTPEIKIPYHKPQSPEKNELRLAKMSLKKLKDLCTINAVNVSGSKEILIERLGNLKEIKWEIHRSTTPIAELSNIAYMKKQRIKNRRTKTIGR